MKGQLLKQNLVNRGWITNNKFPQRSTAIHFLNHTSKNSKSKIKKQFENSSNRQHSPNNNMIMNDKIQILNQEELILKSSIFLKSKTVLTNTSNAKFNENFSALNKNSQKHNSINNPHFQDNSSNIADTRSVQYSRKNQRINNHDQNNERSKTVETVALDQQKKFKATNSGKYKRQMLFLQPNFRHSSSSLKRTQRNGSTIKSQILQQHKADIYKQIYDSFYQTNRNFETMRQKKAEIVQFKPIQYLTQFSQPNCSFKLENDKFFQTSTIKNQTQQNFFQSKKHSQDKYKKKKPNFHVLRDKLKYHYNKQENAYRYRVMSMGMKMQPDIVQIIDDN